MTQFGKREDWILDLLVEAGQVRIAAVAVKNHANGADNSKARFRKRVDRETVLESPMVADPLRLYGFCRVTDGSTALLHCPSDVSEAYADDYLVIEGIAGATDTHVVHRRDDPTVVGAVKDGGRDAFDMADRNPSDVDVAELHDMFTSLEFIRMEALAFADHGRAWERVVDGRTTRDGDLPINTSGGLTSKGHPPGATGVTHVVEIYEQLQGDAGDRQAQAETGLACNVSGFGNGVTTALLGVAG